MDYRAGEKAVNNRRPAKAGFSTIRRYALAGVVAVASAIGGAGAASAWVWARSSSPIIMSGGGGYGNANQVSYNDGVLQSWLKDTVLDGQRVYVNGYADYGSYDFSFQSGRRTDGGSSYARMADKSFTSAYPYGVAQYRYSIELCRDKPLIFDPCSEDKRGWHSGL